MIVKISSFENNLVKFSFENNFLFEFYSGWVYDYDNFLVISPGWLVIMIVSWVVGEIT